MKPEIDPLIIKHAAIRARLLVTSAGFPLDTVDDLEQELMMDCLRRETKYDCSRGDWEGFVRAIMRNHSTVLIARRLRRIKHEVLAEDIFDQLPDREGSSIENFAHIDPTRGLDLSIDIQRVLNGLPSHLQELAWLLADSSIKQICESTGRSRSWVYQMIHQLRDAFAASGLRRSCMVEQLYECNHRCPAKDRTNFAAAWA